MGGLPVTADTVATGLSVGNPAVIGRALRPVALRPCLSTGVPFSNEFKSSHSVDCAVNFQRNWIADFVKSNRQSRNCDHKNCWIRLVFPASTVYLREYIATLRGDGHERDKLPGRPRWY
jgi:hypothetical protein